MMDSRYRLGDRVRARVDAQGLKKGEEYVVKHVRSRSTFVGTYVTYDLVSVVGGRSVPDVGNGHLVLEAV